MESPKLTEKKMFLCPELIRLSFSPWGRGKKNIKIEISFTFGNNLNIFCSLSPFDITEDVGVTEEKCLWQ